MLEKRRGRAFLETRDGLKISVRRNLWDARIVREMFIDSPYVKYTKLSPNPVIVDVGGYIGDFSIYCVHYLKASKVIVYEPTRENYDVTCDNIKINNFGETIEAVNKAVGVDGDVVLNVQELSEEEFHVSLYWYDDWVQRSVPSITIDELYRVHQLEKVDLLKIDCEGGEYDILPDISETILNRTNNIVFEFHKVDGYESKLRKIKSRLESYGYRLYLDGSIITAVSAATK